MSHTRGDVHHLTQVVAQPVLNRAGVEAHPKRGERFLGPDGVLQREAEVHGFLGLLELEHEGVSDLLDQVAGVSRGEFSDEFVQALEDLNRDEIAALVGERMNETTSTKTITASIAPRVGAPRARSRSIALTTSRRWARSTSGPVVAVSVEATSSLPAKASVRSRASVSAIRWRESKSTRSHSAATLRGTPISISAASDSDQACAVCSRRALMRAGGGRPWLTRRPLWPRPRTRRRG